MSSWGNYLAHGVQAPIFHMCIALEFETETKNGGHYYPPTYSVDGFIHATKEPQFLIDVANHFYKASKGDWICIKLEPLLLPPVIFESPAPVGNTAAYDHDGDSPKFPHIYGGIPAIAVVDRYRIVRGEDGSFLSIEGIC